MALGFAVANAQHAHALAAGGINRRLFRELNFGTAGAPSWWLDQQKITTDGSAFGLVPGHHAPDPEHGGVRFPYQAEIEEVPRLLAEDWTPDNPTLLEKFGFRIDRRQRNTYAHLIPSSRKVPFAAEATPSS